MTVHVVTGPPAAGKSTFVREHAAEGDVTIDFDQLATALGQRSPHEIGGVHSAVARAAREAAVGAVLDGVDADVWVIQTYLTDEKRKAFADAGAEFHLVDPGMDVVLAQAEKDDRPDGTVDAIRAWYASDGKSKSQKAAPVAVQKRFVVKDVATEPATGKGQFSALVSTFGTVDSQGEIIEPGAFKATLDRLGDGGTIPILWDHQWDDIWSHIGKATAEETEEGLVVSGELDLENPAAAQAFKLLSDGRVKEFSIGGFERPEDVTTDDGGVRHVAAFDLVEVSMTLRGANPDTRLLDVKSAPTVKEGRVLAGKYVESLKEIQAKLGEIISAVDTSVDDSKSKHDGGEQSPSIVPAQIAAALKLASVGA